MIKQNYRLFMILSLLIFCKLFSKCDSNKINQLNLEKQENLSLTPISLNNHTHIIRIKTPNHIKQIPDIKASYKGYRLNFKNGICTITNAEQSLLKQFILIITKEITIKKDENNKLKYFEKLDNQPCRLFYISESNTSEQWLIQEEDITKIPTRLPEEAIILFLDPCLIDTIKSSTLKSNKEEINSIINLPDIILSDSITTEELEFASNYSSLASIDPDAFCIPLTKTSKKENSVLISMESFQR